MSVSRLRSKNYRIEGIVIKKRDFFEADRILSIFTREKGTISCVVRGARKPGSKLAGVTELFTYGEFFLAKGKKLDILTSSKPFDHFEKSIKNLDKVSHFFLISEFLDKLLPHEVPNEKIFNETTKVFRIINAKDNPEITYAFVYKVLVLLGYGLALKSCVECYQNTKLLPVNFINFETGGVLCENCEKNHVESLKVSANCLKMLRFIEKNQLEEYPKVSKGGQLASELQMTVEGYLNYIYQREMNSSKFIQTVKALES